jgi:hypothetical protein
MLELPNERSKAFERQPLFVKGFVQLFEQGLSRASAFCTGRRTVRSHPLSSYPRISLTGSHLASPFSSFFSDIGSFVPGGSEADGGQNML